MLAMGGARVAGDYLQTAAIFDEQMHVLSLVTDPNDYAGPGTGYEVSPARREEMAGIRQQRASRPTWRDRRRRSPAPPHIETGDGGIRHRSPRGRHRRLAGVPGAPSGTRCPGCRSAKRCGEIVAGLEEEGCLARIVRVNATIDLGMVGLTAARLAGSGIGIGLQGKGTALIHRRDLPPLASLELLSIAPILTAELYRALGANAGRHAKGATPVPARNPYTDEAIEARYHTSVIALVALERDCVDPARPHLRSSGAPVMKRRFSGRPAQDLTIDALRRDELIPDDVRIHPDTLEAQAAVAEPHGNPQLAENFRRAAEMALMSEDEVMALYDALRPHRSTMGELGAPGDAAGCAGRPRCAALVREAADVYARRGLLR